MSRAWSGGSDTRWRTFRLTILDRDSYKCQIRRSKCLGAATQVDHIVPLADGGAKYDPENCRASCAPCNQGRRPHLEYESPVSEGSSWGLEKVQKVGDS